MADSPEPSSLYTPTLLRIPGARTTASAPDLRRRLQPEAAVGAVPTRTHRREAVDSTASYGAALSAAAWLLRADSCQDSALSGRRLMSRPAVNNLTSTQPQRGRSRGVVVITSTLDLQCRACPQSRLPMTRWAMNGLRSPWYRACGDSSAPTPTVAWTVRCFPRRMVA